MSLQELIFSSPFTRAYVPYIYFKIVKEFDALFEWSPPEKSDSINELVHLNFVGSLETEAGSGNRVRASCQAKSEGKQGGVHFVIPTSFCNTAMKREFQTYLDKFKHVIDYLYLTFDRDESQPPILEWIEPLQRARKFENQNKIEGVSAKYFELRLSLQPKPNFRTKPFMLYEFHLHACARSPDATSNVKDDTEQSDQQKVEL